MPITTGRPRGSTHRAVILLATATLGRAAGAVAAAPIEESIRPLLVARCAACHGPETQESGLRLDVRHRALQGGDFGAVIVPGKAAESELIRRITSTDHETMMPPDGARLSPAEVQLLTAWIDSGAEWPESEFDRTARATDRDPRLGMYFLPDPLTEEQEIQIVW